MKKIKKRYVFGAAALLLVGAVCAFTLGTGGSYTNKDGSYKHVTGSKSYKYIVNHPILGGWGDEIITWNPSYLEDIIGPLNMNYVALFMNYKMDNVLDGINFAIDEANAGNLQNLSYYSDEDKVQDEAKNKTGIIYIPGDADKPFAVLFAGGANKCVEVFVEGFPVAKMLHEQGYPVFIVKYRVSYEENRMEIGAEDMCAAMQYILSNAESLGVKTENYSMFGFSAGARMVHRWCEDDAYSYRTHNCEAPGMISLVYGGIYGEFPKQASEVSVYMCMGDADTAFGNEGPNWVREYSAFLEENGFRVMMEMFPETGHGFGNGYGTNAYGWVDHAIDFWEGAS